MASGAASDGLRADKETIAAFLHSSVGDAIHLVAIVPDGPVSGRWFGDDASGAAEWAEYENMRGRGVYWTVNICRAGLNKKPDGGKNDPNDMGDMEAHRFLQVDLDPPKDGSAWNMQEVRNRLATLRYPPSFVLGTGGGLGGFWRLDEPVVDKATITLANQGLEGLLGGDHCHNHDRLMRLPGTVNWPNKKKIEAGRAPAMATILEADDGVSYPLHALAAAFPASLRKTSERPSVASGPFALITADDLELGPLSPLRSAIKHPPGRDGSGDGLAVARLMANAGYSNEQILGILLNSENAVSDHFLRQRDPNRAAMRCVEVVSSPNEAPRQPPNASRAANDSSAAPAPAALSAVANPYVWRDPKAIPPRPWIFGRQLLRGTVGGKFAPGAAGKTTHEVARALSMVTNRPFLGHRVWGGPLRVWLWNLEDSGEELSRTIQATCKHWGITEADIGGRLFVNSALDGAVLKLATQTALNGFTINQPLVDALVDELLAKGIDYLNVDPFISSHGVEENDNAAIDAVVKQWAIVANKTNCAISLNHHVSKHQGETSSLHARGASSLVAACRSALVINRMTPDEANQFGIDGEERRRFIRIYDDKNNRAPPADASEWYQLVSVDLDNGPDDGSRPGDSIGVIVPWQVPDAFENVKVEHLIKVQNLVFERQDKADGVRRDSQAKHWFGKLIAYVIDADLEDEKDKARVKKIAKKWVDNNAFRIENRPDEKRNNRDFIYVDQWANVPGPPRPASPSSPKVGQGCGTYPAPPASPTLYKGEVWRGAAEDQSDRSEVRQEPEGSGFPKPIFPAPDDDEEDPAVDAYFRKDK